MTTTWTDNDKLIGRKHFAWHGNMCVGRVIEKTCKTNEPFFAISENGMTKDFLILQHAKDWIESIASALDGIDFDELAEE